MSHPHRRYLKNFVINKKFQLNLVVPVVILSVTLTAALDSLYYFVFHRFLKFSDPVHGLDFAASGIIVHMAIVSVLITLISVAAISAALIVQTHQILGPLVPIARHIRKLIEGNYSDVLVIRKGDKLHELVKDLNELTKQLRVNDKGQSIVGALIGIAIAGISMLAIMTGLQFGQQGQNQVKYIMDLDNFNEEIRALLSDPAACTNSFGGKVAAAGQSYTISGLYDGTTAPGVVRYTAGSVYGDNSLKLNSMTLKDFVAGAVSTKAQMTLVNDVSSQKVSIGGQAKPRTVNLSLDLDAAGKIVNCIALAKMSDGIWQRTSANVNNIFFMPPPASPAGGNVGIGVADPAVPLVVKGFSMFYGAAPISVQNTNPEGTASVDFMDISSVEKGAVGYGLTTGHLPWAGNLYLSTPDATPIILVTNLTERVRVDAVGNVGIGTTNPQSVLQVNGYVQIKTYSFTLPPAADCSTADHVGRMTIWSPDQSTHKICFCPQDIGQGFGWKCAQGM